MSDLSVAARLPGRAPTAAASVAPAADRDRGLWWSIIAITGATSLGLNITHAITYKHTAAAAESVVDLSDTARVVLAIIASVLPVLMAALLSHAFVVDAPQPIRVAVIGLFLLGMLMSLTAQIELLTPIIGDARAAGTAAIVDVPALISLFMIERGNRLRQAAERARAEHERLERQAAEQARREREAAARQAEQQAADERLAAARQAAEEAAAKRAENERLAAAEQAEAERLAAERARAEQAAAAERAEADRAAAERARAEQAAAEQTTEAERARADRLAAAERVAAEQRATERERADREAAQRQAETQRREEERRARAVRAAERQTRAEQADRGDLTAADKKRLIRAALETAPAMRAPDAVAAVAAAGGQLSEQRARAILAELRQEPSGERSNVRELRSPAAV